MNDMILNCFFVALSMDTPVHELSNLAGKKVIAPVLPFLH
jgi:hypothetical protein